MIGGREFQSWGAEQLNDLLLLVLRQAEGIVRWMEGEGMRKQAGVVSLN